jgi:hypothetical protein
MGDVLWSGIADNKWHQLEWPMSRRMLKKAERRCSP